jgi:hypothetical protein
MVKANLVQVEPGIYVPAHQVNQYEEMMDDLDGEEFDGEDEEEEEEGYELDDLLPDPNSEYDRYYDNESDFDIW